METATLESCPPSHWGAPLLPTLVQNSRVCHLRKASEAQPAEALPRLKVTLAVKAVAADEGAVLPVGPVPALGLTPTEENRGSRRGEKQRRQKELLSDPSCLSLIEFSAVSPGRQQQGSGVSEELFP